MITLIVYVNFLLRQVQLYFSNRNKKLNSQDDRCSISFQKAKSTIIKIWKTSINISDINDTH